MKMVVLGFITGWHKLGTFKPQIKVILGINSGVAIFVGLSVAFMCICVGECPIFRGFLANYIGNMAINQGLDRGASVGGCYNNYFTCPLLLMVMD